MSNTELTAWQQKLQESSLIPTIRDRAGYIRPVSITEAIEKGKKTILTIRKNTEGTKKIVGWVKGRLIELFTYLGAFETVTEYQIQMLALRICNKYFYLTPGELDYFFLAFSNGEYGKLYNKGTINPQDIMQGLIKYEKDLLDARGVDEEKKNELEKKKQKEEEQKLPLGIDGWKVYCKNNGLDPDKHTIKSVNLDKMDVNKVLKK